MFTTEFHSSANSPNIIAFTKLYCGVTVLERVSQNTTISEIAKVVITFNARSALTTTVYWYQTLRL